YLGYTWAERGENLDEALGLIQRAVAADPDNGAYVDSLGWVYYQLGRFHEARPHLEWAARLEPDDATVHEHLGDLYAALGERELSRAAYRRALEILGVAAEAAVERGREAEADDVAGAARIEGKLDALDAPAASTEL
ncbi:MAG: tetratricopeptide repeat protein, partial [Acidobacteriota bacterium]